MDQNAPWDNEGSEVWMDEAACRRRTVRVRRAGRHLDKGRGGERMDQSAWRDDEDLEAGWTRGGMRCVGRVDRVCWRDRAGSAWSRVRGET